MRKNILYLTIILSILSLCISGPLAMGMCYTGCNAVWVACVAAGGGVAGVTTGGAAVPAAILGCNAAQGVCMGGCTLLLAAPTL